MNWITLFSFSGMELFQVLFDFPLRPVLIYSNSKNPLPIKSRHVMRYTHDEICFLLTSVESNTLVTLHGYNRILPDAVVNNKYLDIYNTHPGDIASYPELMGKDPQKKALELKLPSTGVVIHRVTNQVDNGPIVRYRQSDILETDTEETLTDRLRDISVSLWIDFLKEKGL